jgi:AcrR family transcriptional regulator
MQTSEPGLRERKRSETRAKLETAATELVLRDGLEHVTLEAICDAADVSIRTFFNYFDAKEDAILGIRDFDISDEVVTAHLFAHEGADVVHSVVALLFRAINPSITDSQLFRSRMEIVRRYPHLLGRMAAQFARKGDELVGAVRTVLAASTDAQNEAEAESSISAEMVLALCSGATRLAVKEWAATGNHAPIEAVEQRAITLVRSTIERLK